jgi:hypothetical protein
MALTVYDAFSQDYPNKIMLWHKNLNIRGRKTIWTPMIDDFTIGLTNDFSSEPDITSAAMNVVDDAVGTFNEASKMLGGTKNSTTSLKSTIVQWQDSAKPTWSFRFMFPSLKPNDTPLQDALKVMEIAAPGAESDGDNTLWYMNAPGGYAAPATLDFTQNKPFEGTWILKVSDHATIPNLVITAISMQLSKERVKSGQPLWVALDITLEPAMMTTAGAMMKWFNMPSSDWAQKSKLGNAVDTVAASSDKVVTKIGEAIGNTSAGRFIKDITGVK